MLAAFRTRCFCHLRRADLDGRCFATATRPVAARGGPFARRRLDDPLPPSEEEQHQAFEDGDKPRRRREDRKQLKAYINSDDADPTISSLQQHLSTWAKSSKTYNRLVKMGLDSSTSRTLLQRFSVAGQEELDDVSSSDPEMQKQWATDVLNAELGRAGSLDERHNLLDRSVFHRFLSWASSQPAGFPFSTETVDNITTFSPFANLEEIRKVLDLRNPALLYHKTRRSRRKVIMHVGPTNSGKTYNALLALAQAPSGAYAGPLRLLAHEIFDRLNRGLIKIPGKDAQSSARPCNLLTGEERRVVSEDAPLVSATVEMIGTQVPYDVVILDEIQMITDPQRGDAWTRVFLGVQAKELHLCGEETAVPLIRQLVEETGDELVINRYKRLTPLHTGSNPVEKLKNVKKGDCVVAFGRAELFRLKYSIEKETGLKCAMVYGGLPPETRAEQAQLFNDPDSEYDVMVASDAVGMGLNLKIKRVVFAAMQKYDGSQLRPLSVSQTKQIAGRAGRYGLHAEDAIGEATTIVGRDLKLLKQNMSTKLPSIATAVLRPDNEMVERLATLLPRGTTFADMMELLTSSTLLRAPYAAAQREKTDKVQLDVVQSVHAGLPASECMTLMHCPMPVRDPLVLNTMINLARLFAVNARVPLLQIFDDTPFVRSFRTVQKLYELSSDWTESRRKSIANELGDKGHVALSHLESLHKTITGYLWMANRQPAAFPDVDEAREMKTQVETMIDFYLSLVVTSGKRVKIRHDQRVTAQSVSAAVDVGDGVDLDAPPPDEVTHPNVAVNPALA